jgi:FkbM family methyltransferase
MTAEHPPGIRFRTDLGEWVKSGIWWPDYDHAPKKCVEFVRHGLGAIAAVLRHCRQMRECVQAGGHAGLWPLNLAAHFEQVHTFEPERALFDCMTRNCTAANVTMYRHGLGSSVGPARLKSHVSAGSWRIDPQGEHLVNLLTIDALALEHCDAILLDIEGYEVEALTGAADTVERCAPVILCELLPRSQAAIEEWLRRHRYKLAERFGRDRIYVRKGRK